MYFKEGMKLGLVDKIGLFFKTWPQSTELTKEWYYINDNELHDKKISEDRSFLVNAFICPNLIFE